MSTVELDSKQFQLQLAVSNGNIGWARHLLDQGVDPNFSDGVFPLLRYANPHIDLFELLLDRGADPEARNECGETALIWMIEGIFVSSENRPRIIDMLISRGVDVNARDHIGMSPLMWAAFWGRLDTIRVLSAHGALLNQVTKGKWATITGRTALMVAAQRGQAEAVRLLLELGADPTVCDSQGASALELAVGDAALPLLAKFALEQHRSLGTALPSEDQQAKRRL